MKRISILLACIALLAAATAALAAGRPAKLKLAGTNLGKIVANGRGLTVYMFTRDRRNKDNCSAACKGVWPPLTTSGKPVAGRGIKRGLIGTIPLGRGVRQVTYAGHPLYTYIADGGPGDTSYVGFDEFGGRWFALNAAGRAIK
jgi:predicted lipoprotein with Yx(FWY)xxD motif